MSHPSRRLRRLLASAGALLMLAATVGAVHAATTLYFHDGPNWHQSTNTYTFGACADTVVGETVRMQYTTDGSDLTNPPNAGNGTRITCLYTNNSTCAGVNYWTCSIPDTSGLTVKYRFYVMTAANVWSGLMTPQRFFTTGELAVTLNTLAAESASPTPDWLLPALGLMATAGAAGILALGRRK